MPNGTPAAVDGSPSHFGSGSPIPIQVGGGGGGGSKRNSNDGPEIPTTYRGGRAGASGGGAARDADNQGGGAANTPPFTKQIGNIGGNSPGSSSNSAGGGGGAGAVGQNQRPPDGGGHGGQGIPTMGLHVVQAVHRVEQVMALGTVIQVGQATIIQLQQVDTHQGPVAVVVDGIRGHSVVDKVVQASL